MEEVFDIAIAGAGPAGITAALYALRAGLKVAIFDGDIPGGTLRKLNIIENYPGFDQHSGAELSDVMLRQLKSAGGEIIPRFVSNILPGSPDAVIVGGDIYYSKYVILATGIKRNKPEFLSNFRGNGVSFCAICDGNFYKNKVVAVIGNGNEACEDAAYLTGLCEKVYLITENEALMPVKNVEKRLGKVNKILGKEYVEGIEFSQNEETSVLKVEGIFIALGIHGADELVRGIETAGNYVVTDACGKTSFDTIYAIGDLVSGSLKQVVTACGMGAISASEIIKRLKSHVSN